MDNMSIQTLVLIAQAVFLVERGQTDKQMGLNALTHAGVGKDKRRQMYGSSVLNR